MSTTERTYWRIQHAAHPISADHRSQIGDEDEGLGTEAGTSCCDSFEALQIWARGGHANWIDADLVVVEFVGELIGRGTDGECVVRPAREIRRIPFRSARGRLTSAVIQTLVVE